MTTRILRARRLVRLALEKLLAPEDDFYEMNRAIRALGRFFAQETGYNGRNEQGGFGRKTATAFGWAIGPDQAAACLREHLRTRRLLQGVQAGLETARRRFPGESLQVLYAGCGPYALLLLPFALRYDPGAVQVTLLDLHAESLEAVRRLRAALGLTDDGFFRDLIQCDAAEYEPAADRRYHVFVTETMNQALTKEAQVAITVRAVRTALHPDAVLIPAEVLVEAVLADPGGSGAIAAGRRTRAEDIDDQLVLGTVLALNADTARELDGPGLTAPLVFRARLPRPLDRRSELRLRTTIRVHGDLTLRECDCSLTLPLVLAEIDGEAPPEDPVEIRYLPGSLPHYECNLPRTPASRIAPAPAPPSNRLRYRKLDLAFDPERLREDLARVRPEEWFAHYQRGDYMQGAWEVAALRSIGGRADMIYSVPNADYADTDLLKRCPYLREVLDCFECELLSVRLLRLEPGAVLKEHSDHGLAIELGEARLHVPIRTEPEIVFTLNGRPLAMQPGECWYANFELPHGVEHRGREWRVHLVIDCLANDWLRRQILGAAAVFPAV